MTTLRVTKVGDLFGVDAVDQSFVTEVPGGLRLSSYDPEFEKPSTAA